MLTKTNQKDAPLNYTGYYNLNTMIDLNKEAEECAKKHFEITICSDGFYRTYEEWFIAGANSKYVQAEKIKAKIEILNICINYIDLSFYKKINDKLTELEQQLKQLEDGE